MIRVIIADDHHLVRQGLKSLLEDQKDIVVLAEACNGQEAVEMALFYRPDVMILDINMPLVNGLEAAKRIHSADISSRILFLTMYSDESLVKKAFRSGAHGYLLKKSIVGDLLTGIHTVCCGGYYLSPEIEQQVGLDEILSSLKKPDLNDLLTPREREVCQLIAEGNTNVEIANKLTISVKTVEKHRANLMEKLGAEDIAGLIRIAIQQALVVTER